MITRGFQACLLVFPLAGCGWHAGLEAPGGARSIGVEMFEVPREILVRDLEPRLNAAMTRAIVDLVDTPIVSPASADVVVRGVILDYAHRAGVRDKDNQLRESGVYIEASAELVDRRSGRVLGAPAHAHIWTGFVIDPQFSGYENEVLARDRGLRNLAETLVLDLLAPAETGENGKETGE